MIDDRDRWHESPGRGRVPPHDAGFAAVTTARCGVAGVKHPLTWARRIVPNYDMAILRPGEQSRDHARFARNTARRDLVRSGVPEEQAEAWCSAWEQEATRHRLRPDSRYFWDAGRGWIDVQRSFARRGPLERAG